MKVRLIGRGHTWTRDSLCTSYVIDEKLILDVPQGSFKKIYFSTNMEKVHTIVISHLHSDHWFDLHVLTNIILHRRNKDKVVILAPKKLKKYLKLQFKIGETLNLYKRSKKRLLFKALKDGAEYTVPGYRIRAYRVDHCGIDAYGFVISDADSAVGFTCDTTLCDAVNEIIKPSNLVFIDSSNLYAESKTHMSIRDYEYYQELYKDKIFVPVHMSNSVIDYIYKNNIRVEEGHVYDTDHLFE